MDTVIPFLRTDRLMLRSLVPGDVACLRWLASDPEVRRFFPNPNPPTREQVLIWFGRHQDLWKMRGFGVWGLMLNPSGGPDNRNGIAGDGSLAREPGSAGNSAATGRDNGVLIGWCGLQYLAETDEVEVAYLLGKRYWGCGYATEAAAASLSYGFLTAGLDRIIGLIHPHNHRSRRVLEKIGLRLVDCTAYFGMDVLRFALDRAEYAAGV